MNLTPEELQGLARLLDQALKMDVGARDAWLDSLADADAQLAPKLRALLLLQMQDGAQLSLPALPQYSDAELDEWVTAGAPALAPQASVGPYRLLRELGRGGMGSVWLAERADGTLKRQVALKLPHINLPQRQLVERFSRERDILAGLTHPHIARLYDAGVTDDGRPYLALEYVEGQLLNAWCDAQRLTVKGRLDLFLQVLSAVQYAHGQLVVHRDLKPSNILVTPTGEVRLLDFGIAKFLNAGQANETGLTQQGGRTLTPEFASPEQISGGTIGIASDVYALGVVLYELLAGSRPYRLKRDSRGALEEAILTVEPVRPSQSALDPAVTGARCSTRKKLVRQLAGDLDTIVLKALKKNPLDRYVSVDAFAQDLKRHLRGAAVLARPDSAWYRTSRFLRRYWITTGAVGAVVLSLAAGLGVSLWQARVAREQTALAQEQARSSKAVHDFMADIFTANSTAQPDPLKARQTTARELLDLGAAKIDSSLKDAPQARAAVLRLISDMYAELGLNERATSLAEQRLALMRSLRGPEHLDVAEQLLEVSKMMQSTNRAAQRGPLLREALRILDRQPGQAQETRVGVLRQLALFEHDSRDPKALEHATQAVALAELIASPKEQVEALIILGKVQATLDDNTGAEKSLQRALLQAPTATGFAPRQRILLIAYLGDAQIALGKMAAAEANFREGLDLALKLSGPDHIDAAQMEFRLGQILFDSARTRDGLKLIESAHARVERARGANNASFLPNVLRVESAMHVELGDLEGALSLAENGLRLLGAGGSNRNVARLLLLQTALMIETGRAADARATLERFDHLAGATQVATPEEQETANILAVRLLLDEGRRAEARNVFAQNRHVLAQARDSYAASSRLLQWGELVLDLGDATTALDIANKALAQIATDPSPNYLELREAVATKLAGTAALALGDAAAAVAPLRRAVALLETHFDPQRSARLADALVALAQAWGGTGQRESARRALARARSILLRHPELARRHQSRWEQTRQQLPAGPDQVNRK